MIRQIEEEDLKVLTTEGFIARYERECRTGIPYVRAYERVEAIHESITGRRKWNSANAFRQLLYRKNKRRK